jgi:hypothetical protein
MLIANPMYDAVFKYMMDDNKVARLFLGAILGAEITELEFKPQEIATLIPGPENLPSVQILRLDFKASISMTDGTKKLVLIELQKLRIDTDSMRFRRYLGIQYADPNNVFLMDGKERPLPIISIYFLGYTLKNIDSIPVLRIRRKYIDNFTGKEITERTDFVEELSHDMVLIQLPLIKHKKRYELEQLLSIFDEQNQTVVEMRHPIPAEYEPILQRLHAALSDDEVRHARLAQEELLYEFATREKALEEAKRKEEQERKLKEEAIGREKKAIANLINRGITIQEISLIYNLSAQEINNLLS